MAFLPARHPATIWKKGARQQVATRWNTVFDGHAIWVVNTWFSCKLYIDGDCRDTDKQALAWNTRKPRLSAPIRGKDGKTHSVVVFAKSGWVGVKIKICVDGRQVGGDRF